MRIINDDCLNVVKTFESESIDLIYLDPPFNTGKDWKQFDDRFKPDLQSRQQTTGKLRQLLDVFSLGYCDYMAIRLKELHRVLKPTGSLYLHCDPTASHYIKLILDAVFGFENYRNEIVWLRSKSAKGSQFDAKKFGKLTDSIFFYTKADSYLFNLKGTYREKTQEELDKIYTRVDEKGRYTTNSCIERAPSMGARPNLVYEYKGYTPGPAGWRITKEKLIKLDEQGDLGWTSSGRPFRKRRIEFDEGEVIGSFWGDINPLSSQDQERMGYPTQKPEALLERIIKASSNEGDLILDPFCGCGTTIAVAERLKRRWIGIDINPQAVELTTKRLKDNEKYENRSNQSQA